jgi:hypothetical protein
MQMKSTGDDLFVASLTAKYGGMKFHYIDGPLNGFSMWSMVSLLRTIVVYFGN